MLKVVMAVTVPYTVKADFVGLEKSVLKQMTDNLLKSAAAK